MYWHNFRTNVIYLLGSLVISLLQRLHQHDTRSENLEQNFAESFTDSNSLIDTTFNDELDSYIENANRRANKNSFSALKKRALYELGYKTTASVPITKNNSVEIGRIRKSIFGAETFRNIITNKFQRRNAWRRFSVYVTALT